MIHEIIVPFVWLIIPLIAVLIAFRIRTNYKIAQIKQQGKEDKNSQTIEGGIKDFFNKAPKQLEQIDSELATLRAQSIKEHLTEDQTRALLGRLQSERDMLAYAVKYGSLVKPFIKPIDKIANRLLGSFTGEK